MAIDRCSHFGELAVEAGLTQGRVNGTEGALRRGLRRDETLVVLARNGMRADQAFSAGTIGFGEFEVGDAAATLCDQAVDLGLEGTWVDLEQKLALLDACSVGEGDAIYIATDARSKLDCVYRLQAPGKFLPLAQRLMNHLGDRHFRQRRIGGSHGLCSGVANPGKHDQRYERGAAQERRGLADAQFLERHG